MQLIMGTLFLPTTFNYVDSRLHAAALRMRAVRENLRLYAEAQRSTPTHACG